MRQEIMGEKADVTCSSKGPGFEPWFAA